LDYDYDYDYENDFEGEGGKVKGHGDFRRQRDLGGLAAWR
jgi:hypothetical protein